jgi:hypothetical protein
MSQLLNNSPVAAMDDVLNRFLGYVEDGCDLSQGQSSRMQAEDLYSIIPSQFGSPGPSAASLMLPGASPVIPILRLLVGHVVLMCAEPEMSSARPDEAVHRVGASFVVPDTTPNVACVEHVEAFRDGQFSCNHPCETVSAHHVASIDLKAPIAIGGLDATSPQPALTGPLNACAEALNLGAHADEMAAREAGVTMSRNAASTSAEQRGIIDLHRDLPISRNRGAGPGPFTADAGHFGVSILPSNLLRYQEDEGW